MPEEYFWMAIYPKPDIDAGELASKIEHNCNTEDNERCRVIYKHKDFIHLMCDRRLEKVLDRLVKNSALIVGKVYLLGQAAREGMSALVIPTTEVSAILAKIRDANPKLYGGGK